EQHVTIDRSIRTVFQLRREGTPYGSDAMRPLANGGEMFVLEIGRERTGSLRIPPAERLPCEIIILNPEPADEPLKTPAQDPRHVVLARQCGILRLRNAEAVERQFPPRQPAHKPLVEKR